MQLALIARLASFRTMRNRYGPGFSSLEVKQAKATSRYYGDTRVSMRAETTHSRLRTATRRALACTRTVIVLYTTRASGTQDAEPTVEPGHC
eukprot:scaffold186995_cov43-Prasinocladus_malaysianus.AAC.1